MDRNQALWGGTAGGVCRDGGGIIREKENHYPFARDESLCASFPGKEREKVTT